MEQYDTLEKLKIAIEEVQDELKKKKSALEEKNTELEELEEQKAGLLKEAIKEKLEPLGLSPSVLERMIKAFEDGADHPFPKAKRAPRVLLRKGNTWVINPEYLEFYGVSKADKAKAKADRMLKKKNNQE